MRVGLLDNADSRHENAVVNGCMQCHWTFVVAEANGKLRDWPNDGARKVGPDGALGSWPACHARHSFSKGAARKPQSPGRCHLGPSRPRMEICPESKHCNKRI